MTIDDSQIPVDVLTAAAQALAAAFGLGDEVATATEWPVEDGDSVLAATLSGDLLGTLFLAVNGDVAVRLSEDEASLRRGFEEAAAAITTASGLTVTIDQVGATQDAPAQRISISDAGSLTAMFGCTAAATTAAVATSAAGTPAPSDPPHGDGPAHFDPTPLMPGSDDIATSSLGPLTLLQDVEMDVTVELGRTTMPIRELLALQPGMVVEIDRAAGAPIDVLVNGRLIACGEVVVIDEEFGVRITEIVASGGHL